MYSIRGTFVSIIRAFHLSVESPIVIVLFIRAFHLSVESPIVIVLFIIIIIIIIIFLPSKKIFVLRLIEKLYSPSYSTS